MKKNKIGRNSQCPCGSGRKYKKCHLFEVTKNSPDIIEIQRELQQGLGNPIASNYKGGDRTITVGGINFSGEWVTFHEFLLFYLGYVFSYDNTLKQMRGLDSISHPLNLIFRKMLAHIESKPKINGQVSNGKMTGAVSLCLSLAYNLYLIAHNSIVQEELINRLKKTDQFVGALYETYVAAIFIKSGFEISFEDEKDRSRSHCEFTATHKITGLKYSVEAKSKHWKSELHQTGISNPKIDFIKLLTSALKKFGNPPIYNRS